jgi:hypothetical protein
MHNKLKLLTFLWRMNTRFAPTLEYILHFNSNSVSLFSQFIQFKFLFRLSFNLVVRSLFNFYSIIVQLLFSILILEMYSRYFDPIEVNCKEVTITCNLESINIKYEHKTSLLFLSICRVLRRPSTTIDISRIYLTNFSNWGWGGRDNYSNE